MAIPKGIMIGLLLASTVAGCNSSGAPASSTPSGASVAVQSSGTVATVAGRGPTGAPLAPGSPPPGGFADGPAAEALFNNPTDVAVDAAGNIYVVDQYNSLIRKVSVDGTVSTLAGRGGGFDPRTVPADGTGTVAQFFSPSGLDVDQAGNLYIADTESHRIRKVTPAGVVTTVAGSDAGTADGAAATAQFGRPQDVAVAADGTIYVADGGSVRKISPVGVVSTLAAAPLLQFQALGIAVDAQGTVFIANISTNSIERLDTAGARTTIAGGRAFADRGYADGTGTAANFNGAGRLALDADGNIVVTDAINNRIRKVTPQGVVTTLAGSGPTGADQGSFADGPLATARFNRPQGLAIDSRGRILVADTFNERIRRIVP